MSAEFIIKKVFFFALNEMSALITLFIRLFIMIFYSNFYDIFVVIFIEKKTVSDVKFIGAVFAYFLLEFDESFRSDEN